MVEYAHSNILDIQYTYMHKQCIYFCIWIGKCWMVINDSNILLMVHIFSFFSSFFFFFDIGVRVIPSLHQPWNNQQPTMTINQLHLLPVNTFSLFSILFFFVHSSNPYQINQLTIDPFSQNDKIAIGNTHLSQPQQQSNMMYHSFICPSPTHCKFDSIIY